ncbi:MAG: hypothetical protein B7Z80_06590 [Rhodospirillales bacterium 20-64-7]|nr:MAG: hypothetical protein B7Z80_06590 [Rhodospirillales bacterium 20-64-7]HQT75510.1 hypothetical protein [Rhodopila sp.]
MTDDHATVKASFGDFKENRDKIKVFWKSKIFVSALSVPAGTRHVRVGRHRAPGTRLCNIGCQVHNAPPRALQCRRRSTARTVSEYKNNLNNRLTAIAVAPADNAQNERYTCACPVVVKIFVWDVAVQSLLKQKARALTVSGRFAGI